MACAAHARLGCLFTVLLARLGDARLGIDPTPPAVRGRKRLKADGRLVWDLMDHAVGCQGHSFEFFLAGMIGDDRHEARSAS